MYLFLCELLLVSDNKKNCIKDFWTVDKAFEEKYLKN